jgi:hypothetical protein
MILAQVELDAILNRKVRKRVLELPVRHGRLGELKRCPMRRGGVYHLKPPLPFDRFLERAPESPAPTRRHEPAICSTCKGTGKVEDILAAELGLDVRCPRCGGVGHLGVAHYGGSPSARSVLWLIGRVERWEPKPVTITVSHEPERQGDLWLVSFLLFRGENAEDEARKAGDAMRDEALFLSGDGGFTSAASRQAVPGDPPYCAPFAADLERAREAARQKRLTPAQTIVSRMKADAMTCRDVMISVKAANRARLIQKELEKLASEVGLDNGAMLSRSDRAACQAPVAAEDGTRPRGTDSDLRRA